MGLATDSIFIQALQSNAELMELIGGDAATQQQTQQEGPAEPQTQEETTEQEEQEITTEPQTQESTTSLEQTQEDEEILPRLYGTAIPMPDEDAENVAVPYVIVTFDGLNNDTETKENLYEGDYDRVSIGVEVTAKTLEDLHDLSQMVRDTILGYFRETETSIEDYTMSADAIQYDSMKPCYWQVLRYQCNVNNLFEEENEQD